MLWPSPLSQVHSPAAVMRLWQGQLGKGIFPRVYWLTHSHHKSIPEGNLRAGISGQELKQRPWRKAVSWLIQTAFLYNPDPGWPLTTVRWTVPYRLLIQENVPQICSQANLMEVIPQLRFSLLDDSSLSLLLFLTKVGRELNRKCCFQSWKSKIQKCFINFHG